MFDIEFARRRRFGVTFGFTMKSVLPLGRIVFMDLFMVSTTISDSSLSIGSPGMYTKVLLALSSLLKMMLSFPIIVQFYIIMYGCFSDIMVMNKDAN